MRYAICSRGKKRIIFFRSDHNLTERCILTDQSSSCFVSFFGGIGFPMSRDRFQTHTLRGRSRNWKRIGQMCAPISPPSPRPEQRHCGIRSEAATYDPGETLAETRGIFGTAKPNRFCTATFPGRRPRGKVLRSTSRSPPNTPPPEQTACPTPHTLSTFFFFFLLPAFCFYYAYHDAGIVRGRDFHVRRQL